VAAQPMRIHHSVTPPSVFCMDEMKPASPSFLIDLGEGLTAGFNFTL
jgi:hypothetical protein